MRTNLKIGIVLIAVAIAVIGSGYTYAFFSDQQDATGNAFTAGRLTLQVGTDEVLASSISANNLVPSATFTNAGTLEIQNTGSITGTFKLKIDTVVDAENTRYHPETVAGDLTAGTTDNGELSQFLKIALWIDADKDGVCETGEKYINSDGTIVTLLADGLSSDMFFTVGSFNTHGMITYGTIAATTSIGNLKIAYYLPNDDSINQVQTDGLTYSMHFYLDQ
jgi:predicted ribosomally synthesized peptide with SipW-like signal peptide